MNKQEDYPMTYTIWSNAGKFEWILRLDETIVRRSGLIFHSRAKAIKDFKNFVKEI